MQSPKDLTRAQRIAISIRGQSSIKATIKKKGEKTQSKNVSWSLSVPLCADCTPILKSQLGCQRFASLSPKVPHRFDYASDPKKAPRIAFCPRSYDDHSLDREVFKIISEIDKEGLYPYFGKPIQHLPNRTVEIIQEVRDAWRRLHQERDAIEGGH